MTALSTARHERDANSRSAVRSVIVRVLLFLCFALPTGTPFGADLPFKFDSYQERRLWEPTPKELEAERNGQIYIYDGLQQSEVDTAMEQQFGRIESMMFIRTASPPKNEGEAPTIEDDGCE
jgi:hypothetical protein